MQSTQHRKQSLRQSLIPLRPFIACLAALCLSLHSPQAQTSQVANSATRRLPQRSTASTYRNPLVRDVADPFVLKHRGEYYLYRTGGTQLDVLTSRDLVHWRPGPVIWKAPSPQAENAHSLWAPEVYYENGMFYLYFNASSPSGEHRLWLATADSPLGPFRIHPSGSLTSPWRIDASMFLDDDGTRYLYSCLQQADAGRLTGWAHVEGRPISGPWQRAEGEWQAMLKPTERWEGSWIEAPTILKDDSGYYLLYSGGGAHLAIYQVGYATAPHPLGPWTKKGILIPTVPGVPGPGHQAVVLAADNLTPYLVYHRKRLAETGWQRELMLDRMAMGGGLLSTRAPTMTPQPMPPRPAFEDHFDSNDSRRSWAMSGGNWAVNTRGHELMQNNATAPGRARLTGLTINDGVIEVNLRRLSAQGGLGLALSTGSGAGGSGAEAKRFPVVLFANGDDSMNIATVQGVGAPVGINARVHHQLLLTRRGGSVEVKLDGRRIGDYAFARGRATVELVTERCAAAFSGIAVTNYTKPLPLGPREPLTRRGWHRSSRGSEQHIEQRSLGAGQRVYALDQTLPANGTMTVRIQGWALGVISGAPKYGVRISAGNSSDHVEAYIDPTNSVLATHGWIGGRELRWQNSDLPVDFEYTDQHELKLSWRGDQWRFAVDGGSVHQRSAVLRAPLRPVLITEDARAVFSIGVR